MKIWSSLCRRVLPVMLVLILSVVGLPSMTVSALAYGDFQYEILSNGTAMITKYIGASDVVEIPGEVNGIRVSTINNSVFGNTCSNISDYLLPNIIENTTLKAVVVSEGITHIAPFAFAECRALKAVQLPSTLVDIGRGAFYGCRALDYIEIPCGVRVIREDTFTHCYALEEVVIPEGVEIIEAFAFYRNDSLEAILIPASVKEIGKDGIAFDEQYLKLIYGYSGTAAEEYAYMRQIPFFSLGTIKPAIPYGNVDGLGRVTAVDALLALQAATNRIQLDRESELAADVDEFAGVSANDALLILQYATKKITIFPIER